MVTIHFTAKIIGGPHDGAQIIYDGASEKPETEVLDKMDKVQLGNHIYKIIEFDRQKMYVVMVWLGECQSKTL